MIGHQPDIYKISLYTQDSYEAKYQLLINICEGVSLKEYKNSKAFLVYLNDIEGSTQLFKCCHENLSFRNLMLGEKELKHVAQQISPAHRTVTEYIFPSVTENKFIV